jgi:FixJ family two-component response regulator
MDHPAPISAPAHEEAATLAVALVDPDDASRRALHLVLSGQRYRVRSYDSSAALVEDPKAVDADWLIVSVRAGAESLAAVGRLRFRGWRGRLAVIADIAAMPERDGQMIGSRDLILAHPVAPHTWRIGLSAAE